MANGKRPSEKMRRGEDGRMSKEEDEKGRMGRMGEDLRFTIYDLREGEGEIVLKNRKLNVLEVLP